MVPLPTCCDILTCASCVQSTTSSITYDASKHRVHSAGPDVTAAKCCCIAVSKHSVAKDGGCMLHHWRFHQVRVPCGRRGSRPPSTNKRRLINRHEIIIECATPLTLVTVCIRSGAARSWVTRGGSLSDMQLRLLPTEFVTLPKVAAAASEGGKAQASTASGPVGRVSVPGPAGS